MNKDELRRGDICKLDHLRQRIEFNSQINYEKNYFNNLLAIERYRDDFIELNKEGEKGYLLYTNPGFHKSSYEWETVYDYLFIIFLSNQSLNDLCEDNLKYIHKYLLFHETKDFENKEATILLRDNMTKGEFNIWFEQYTNWIDPSNLFNNKILSNLLKNNQIDDIRNSFIKYSPDLIEKFEKLVLTL